jgi:hypothetical protein
MPSKALSPHPNWLLADKTALFDPLVQNLEPYHIP